MLVFDEALGLCHSMYGPVSFEANVWANGAASLEASPFCRVVCLWGDRLVARQDCGGCAARGGAFTNCGLATDGLRGVRIDTY